MQWVYGTLNAYFEVGLYYLHNDFMSGYFFLVIYLIFFFLTIARVSGRGEFVLSGI